MTINKTKTSVPAPSHVNAQGGTSFDIKNPLTRLEVAAASCFFGEPMFYHDGSDAPKKGASHLVYRSTSAESRRQSIGGLLPDDWYKLNSAELIEKAIDEALDFDATKTLQFAARLRNEDHIRVTPQVILVRAAHHSKVRGTKLVREYAPQIIKRTDEFATGLAYHVGKYGKDAPVPNSLKRAWRDGLEKQTEYGLAKYRMENKTVKTVDVVNLVHPVRTEAIDKLVKGTLKLSVEDTWEALISKEGSNKETWTKAIEVMGHMALLRNLRNLIQNDVDHKLFTAKLIEGARTGQQLPFRYLSAFKALEGAGVTTGPVYDAIEECLELSLDNLPKLPGVVMSIIDVSGSMSSTMTSSLGTTPIKEIAGLSGVLAAQAGDEGYAMLFGTSASKVFPVRKKESIISQAKNFSENHGCGHGTSFSSFWRKLIDEKIKVDHLFVLSDMQAGDDHQSNKMIQEYRQKVNANVQVYLTQLGGYQDTVVPEIYNKTYVLGGWSENFIKFAAKINNIIK